MRITSPASRMEMARVMGHRNPVFAALGFDQLQDGESWALWTDAGDLIGVGGIVPCADETGNIWLMLDRAMAAQRMLTVVKAIRLTLAAGGYHGLQCRVETLAGARIAAMCGFVPKDDNSQFREMWIYAPASDAEKRQERLSAGAGAGASGGGAATGSCCP